MIAPSWGYDPTWQWLRRWNTITLTATQPSRKCEPPSPTLRKDWLRVVPIAALTPEMFAEVLSEIEPLRENPLDALAARLKKRIPHLF